MKAALYLSLFLFISIQHCSGTVIALRFVNGLSNGPNVSVFLGNSLVFTNIDFGGVTQYRDIEAGTYEVRVVQENNGALIYAIDAVTFHDPHTTIVAHGSVSQSDEFPYAIAKLVDDNDPHSTNSRIRFYHASAGSPSVNVTVANQTIFNEIDYTGLTRYTDITEGIHIVEILNSRNGEAYVRATVPFNDATIVNVYFAGTIGASSDGEIAIIAIDVEDGIRETTNPASLLSCSVMLVVVTISMIL